MNFENVTIVDAPEVTLAPNDEAGDLLLHFYRALGWNGEDILDPCKVRTTKEVYNHLGDLMCERYPNPIRVAMFLLNKGPGTENYIPPNKVYLIDGWIKPS